MIVWVWNNLQTKWSGCTDILEVILNIKSKCLMTGFSLKVPSEKLHNKIWAHFVRLLSALMHRFGNLPWSSLTLKRSRINNNQTPIKSPIKGFSLIAGQCRISRLDCQYMYIQQNSEQDTARKLNCSICPGIQVSCVGWCTPVLIRFANLLFKMPDLKYQEY